MRDLRFKIVSLKVNPSYAPSGHNTMEQLAKGHFFERLQNYMENKSGGNENKILLGYFNCIKGMVKTKHKEFINVVPIIPCQNSSWIKGSRISGGRRTQILLSLPPTIDHMAQDPQYTGPKLIYKLLTIPRPIIR